MAPFYWSGLRGSNSLPPPWQGGALPDELNPHQRHLLYWLSLHLSREKTKISSIPTSFPRRETPKATPLRPQAQKASQNLCRARRKQIPIRFFRRQVGETPNAQALRVWLISESQNLKRESKSLILSLELIQRADFAPRAYTA